MHRPDEGRTAAEPGQHGAGKGQVPVLGSRPREINRLSEGRKQQDGTSGGRARPAHQLNAQHEGSTGREFVLDRTVETVDNPHILRSGQHGGQAEPTS